MALLIDKTEKIAVTTTAKDVNVNRRSFLLKNGDESKSLYFREKSEDGAAVTVDNGFMLGPGEMIPCALTAKTLSIKGEASLSAYILYCMED